MDKIVQTAGRTALGEYAPQFAHFNDDVLFGENWNNQDLDMCNHGCNFFLSHSMSFCIFKMMY